MKHFTLLLLTVLGLASIACDDDDEGSNVVLDDMSIENLYAPSDVRDQTTGEIIEEKDFVYFSFDRAGMVDPADGTWDLGFKGTTIITNSGVSGNGAGGAVVLNALYEEVIEAPSDNEYGVDMASELAIPNGSGNGWYNYNPMQFTISPIPGRVLVIRTHDGKYAKVEMLSYYKDAPAEPNAFVDEADYLTFRYIYNELGGRELE